MTADGSMVAGVIGEIPDEAVSGLDVGPASEVVAECTATSMGRNAGSSIAGLVAFEPASASAASIALRFFSVG